jgi:hypothetical protein
MRRKIGPGGYQYRSCIQLGVASLGQWLAHLSFIVALTLLGVASPSLACAEPVTIECICIVTPNNPLVRNGIQADFVSAHPKDKKSPRPKRQEKTPGKFTCDGSPCTCKGMNGNWGEFSLSQCEDRYMVAGKAQNEEDLRSPVGGW